MPRKRKPDPSDLEKMVTHVLYEIDMFRQCFTRWRAMDDNDPEWNQTLECSLLHFRVLREFFVRTTTPDHDDDVVALDYISPSMWRPIEAPVIAETKEQIDKRLAHLTTQRLQNTPWKRGEMENAMEDLVTLFKDSLHDPEAGWFSKLQPRVFNPVTVGDVSNSTATVTWSEPI